jgi:hypothetical protein
VDLELVLISSLALFILEIVVAVEGLRRLVTLEWPVVLLSYIRVAGRGTIRRRGGCVGRLCSQGGMRVVVMVRDNRSV